MDTEEAKNSTNDDITANSKQIEIAGKEIASLNEKNESLKSEMAEVKSATTDVET